MMDPFQVLVFYMLAAGGLIFGLADEVLTLHMVVKKNSPWGGKLFAHSSEI